MSVVFKKDTGGTLNTGLVSYWRLNDLVDSAGSNNLIQAGNNGVPAGNDVTFQAGGKGLGFARFVKTSATVFQALRGNAVGTTRTKDFSFCAWVRIDPSLTNADIFHNGDATIANNFENNGWSVGMRSGQLSATANALAENVRAGTINTSDFVFIVLTVTSANTWSIYKNNVVVASVTGTEPKTPTSNVEFGISSLWPALYGSQLPLQGDVQESGLWNKVLSALEISDLFNSGIGQGTVTIISYNGSHGTISPLGSNVIDGGANQTYTITPEEGYIIDDVIVDGVSVGTDAEYTFTNLVADHTIIALFKIYVPQIHATQDGSKILLSWDIIANAKQYQLERKTPYGSWTLIGNLYSNSYIDSPILSNTTYNYRLKSIALPDYTDSVYCYVNIRTSDFSGQPQAQIDQQSKEPLSNSVRFGDDQSFNEFYFGQPEGSFRTLEKYLPRFIQ